MVIVVRPEPYTAGPYALSIGVTPETGNVGDTFRFVGILTVNGSPMMGITVELTLEGVGVVGEDVTGSMGNYDITWVADQSGTISFHAEAPGVGTVSDTISITVEEAPAPTNLSLTASPASGTPPFYTTLTATLRSNSTPLGYKEVEIYMRYEGISWTKLTWGDTNASGVRSFIIHVGLVPLEFYAYFAGDNEYDECASPIVTITAEAPPQEPFTSVMDFVVPAYLPAGSSVSVSVLLKNTGGATGLLDVYIDGNPDDPDRERTVETGTTYPTEVAPGGSVWLEIPFRYDLMPNWDFNLTARNYEGTSSISKTITVEEAPVGIPTTLTLSAPSKADVNEKFNISGILYETEAGTPIPSQPINHSYDGRSLGGSTTGVDGDYLKEVSIPESGTWTIKSEFPGTPGYAASKSVADAIVAATPLTAAIKLAGSIATGLALFIYGIS